jgi:membrane-associated phospholipid phosphatase
VDAVAASRLAKRIAYRWLLLSDYGAAAQRHMTIAWACIFALVATNMIWLANSSMVFATANWPSLFRIGLWMALLGGCFALALRRLGSENDRTAHLLTSALERADLAWRSFLPTIALLTALVTYSYLATAAALPLRDDVLAAIDVDLGFHWPSFLSVVNASPLFFKVLTTAYDSIEPVGIGMIIWLALFRRGERLAEFIAVLSVTVIALCVVMLMVPAAGAFAFYQPAPELYANLAPAGAMWTFSREFTMLRNGSLSVIDLAATTGVVSFPSFHTILAIVTVYPLRDTRWLMRAVMAVNGTMIVATMPVGGHHLADVLAGAAVAVGAIIVVRRALPLSATALQGEGALVNSPGF